MSSGIAFDAKEQVRQAVDIVDLVGSYLQLQRSGRGYKALCPWHNDSDPSLQVNPERQAFRCWVCDIGGDVFSFMMKMEGITFPEALAMLAERAGIKLQPTHGHGPGGDPDEKRTLFDAMKWAEHQYHECLLKAPEADAARKYLDSRGLTPETISNWRLGFSPERWDWLLERARDTRFSPKVLSKIGLLGYSENSNRYYDRFRGRVLFSIHDAQGRPVGCGGRVLPGNTDEKAAKYVNSPETPLFSKSRLLYGLDTAREAMSKTRTAIVMEGYTDCLVAHQCGFKNAVAVLGTALGERQIYDVLKRHVDRTVLVLDGDDAGRRRTDQILELFIAEHLDLRILTLPDDLDPCDFLLERGAAAFESLLATAVDPLEHRFQSRAGSFGTEVGTHEANEALEQVLATLAKAPRLNANTTSAARLKEDQILNRLALRFRLSEATLRNRLTEMRRGAKRPTRGPAPEAVPAVKETSRQTLAERWLMEIVIQQPELLMQIRAVVQPEQLGCPRRRAIYMKFIELADAGVSPSFERLMLEFDEPDVQSTLVELDEEHRALRRADPAKELRDLLQSFGDDLQRQRGPRAPAVEPTTRESDEMAALREALRQKRSRQGISVSTDG